MEIKSLQIVSDKYNDKVLLLLSSDLTDNFSVHSRPIFESLKGKNQLILKNNGITNWNQQSVITLYACLKYLSEDIDVKFQDLPEGMERLLLLALQLPLKKSESQRSEENFLERLGAKGIFIFQRFKYGSIFLKQIFASWWHQLTGQAVYRKKDFWLALENCGPRAIGVLFSKFFF